MRSVPWCVGIIADGNRRFAEERNVSREEGHRLGYEKFKDVALWAKEYGIQYVVAYAFSTENWSRSPEEISDLIALFHFGLSPKEISFFVKEKIRLSIIGERHHFSDDLLQKILEAQNQTRTCNALHFVFAISYGGRAEILNAVKRILAGKSRDEISRMSENEFSHCLWTGGDLQIPDPGIVIRTGGARRLSNFLPWQTVYSELFFTDTYWPKFSKEEFFSILNECSLRQRRFGR